MKHVDGYRDPAGIRACADAIARTVTRPWTLMEVCGGQTHAIVRHGLDALLPDEVSLVHGPGCPVCVTAVDILDCAHTIASRPEVIFCTFGDMLRVPGSRSDLYQVKAAGGDVRIVYSPLDALALARERPDREVVFFAVGFETTAPANAMAVHQAQVSGVRNFSLLVSHVTVPPAIEAILSAPGNRVQGFLAAGHVCTVMGVSEYESLVRRHRVPIVVTGFEPLDILQGVLMCVRQLEQGRAVAEIQYTRAVGAQGNVAARALVEQVFEPVDRDWRGIGTLPGSGLALSDRYRDHDALRRFGPVTATAELTAEVTGEVTGEVIGECISGQILQGLRRPHECPAFGSRCTPERPLGATMVSSEGACAAYYLYRSA